MYMDQPNLQPTDIIPYINYAWEQSFARIVTSKKAIADRGWGALNFNLLVHDNVKATMNKSEQQELLAMMKSPCSVAISTSTLSNSTISDITGDSRRRTMIHPNYDPKFYMNDTSSLSSSITTTLASKMNFKTGGSAFAVCTLLHETDLNETRETNQKLAQSGRDTRKKLDSVKKLTAMLNFNNFGCQIRQDTSDVRLRMPRKKHENELKVQ